MCPLSSVSVMSCFSSPWACCSATHLSCCALRAAACTSTLVAQCAGCRSQARCGSCGMGHCCGGPVRVLGTRQAATQTSPQRMGRLPIQPAALRHPGVCAGSLAVERPGWRPVLKKQERPCCDRVAALAQGLESVFLPDHRTLCMPAARLTSPSSCDDLPALDPALQDASYPATVMDQTTPRSRASPRSRSRSRASRSSPDY